MLLCLASKHDIGIMHNNFYKISILQKFVITFYVKVTFADFALLSFVRQVIPTRPQKQQYTTLPKINDIVGFLNL